MDGLEEKLGAVLNNPQMMQQIMTMAQTLNSQTAKEDAPAEAPPAPSPEIDFAALQKLTNFARQGNIDKDQKELLKALSPFLSKERIFKLEKAMRAAKMAKFASAALWQGGFLSQSGR